MRSDISVKDKRKKIKLATTSFIKKHKLEDNPNVKIGIMSEDESIGNIKQFKTGNVPVDILTGGLFQGMVNVIYGNQSVGKSTFIRDMVNNG